MGKKNKHKHAQHIKTSQPDGLEVRLDMAQQNTHHEKEVEKSLEAIYRDEKGNIPDLTTFDARRSRRWLVIGGVVGGFLIFVTGLAWLGSSFFKPFRAFTGQGVQIDIEGPERIALGEETTYFINYKNQTSEPLAATEFRVSFPPDFMVREVEPHTTGQGLVWRVGALPTEGRGTLKVHGTFTGALGTTTAVQVVATYRPASFNSDFEALATKVVTYGESVLHARLEVPAKVLPGDKVALKYQLENSSQQDFDGLELRMTLPEGFEREVGAREDLIDGRVARLSIGHLAAGASTTRVVSGTFASGFSGEAHVVAEAGRVSADGVFLPAEHLETSFTVLAGDLTLNIVMNGNTKDGFITADTPLHFSLGYENTASEDLSNVVLRLRFEPAATSTKMPTSGFVDWSSLETVTSGTRKGQTLSWTEKELPILKRLPHGQDGNIDLSFDALPANLVTAGIAFRVVAEADVGSVGTTKVNRVVRSLPMVLTYLGDADVSVDARYFSEEGAPLGSGPIPPFVGQATTYRIHWAIGKHTSELKNLQMSVALSKIASWANITNVSAGAIAYDQKTRTVRWTLNRLPQNAPNVSIDFDITITPSEADAGRFAQLLAETKFEALDASSNQPLLRIFPSLNSDLDHDEAAKGKGVVRK